MGIRSRADRQIEIEKIALLDGTLLEDVTPNADGAVTQVPHKLGRPWRGYFVARQKYSGNEEYLSASQTPSISSLQTFEHGLGRRPTHVRMYIIARSTDHGYSVGDEVDLGTVDSATASRGFSVYVRNETEVKYVIGSGGIVVLNPGTAASTSLVTPGNWNLFMKCTRVRSLVDVSNKTADADRGKYLYLKGFGFTGADKVDVWVF